jgi:Pin2-interacting protein X1
LFRLHLFRKTDASRFGQAYLEKFGWDASKGLGVSGEGRTSAIKASQKLDMLGIGMRQQGDLEGGIAWRQNRDFENLLRRLNDGTTTEAATTNSTELLDSFHKARARDPESEALEMVKDDDDDDDGNSDGGEGQEGVMAKKEEKKKKKKKKRKATAAEEEEVEEREGLDRKERKKRRKKSSSKDDDDDGRAPVPSSIKSEPPPPRPASREARPAKESGSVPMDTATATRPTAMTAPVPVRAPYVACTFCGSENQRLTYSIYPSVPPPSPRTHRARIIAAKRMAASNSTALAEILGIPSSSSSSSAHPSAVASPLPDPAPTTSTTTSNAIAITSEAKDLLQNLTTSSQSVGDYFKAKLNAKAHGERQARPTSAAASASTRDDEDDDDDDSRAGLGSGLGFGGGPSRIPPPDGLDEEPVRGGIGASSMSMFATMFMPRQPTPPTNAREENTPTAGAEIVVSHDASDCDDNPEKSEKMRAKEERRRKKEERRRKRAEAEAGQEVDRVAVDDGARAAKSKKHREPETPDGGLEDSLPSGADGREAIAAKKRKKDKKSSKHRGLE